MDLNTNPGFLGLIVSKSFQSPQRVIVDLNKSERMLDQLNQSVVSITSKGDCGFKLELLTRSGRDRRGVSINSKGDCGFKLKWQVVLCG